MLSWCSLQLSSIWSSVIVGQVWVWVGRRSELRLCIAVATDGRMKTLFVVLVGEENCCVPGGVFYSDDFFHSFDDIGDVDVSIFGESMHWCELEAEVLYHEVRDLVGLCLGKEGEGSD